MGRLLRPLPISQGFDLVVARDVGVSGHRRPAESQERNRRTLIRYAVVDKQALSLADCVRMAGGKDVDVYAFCSRCSASLGHYWAGWQYPRRDRRDVIVLAEAGSVGRAGRPGMIDRAMGLAGPRTQPGLYDEEFDGRRYKRKRCSSDCPTNEKRRLEDLGSMPVTPRSGGGFTLVF
jgi:hypothetical protein